MKNRIGTGEREGLLPIVVSAVMLVSSAALAEPGGEPSIEPPEIVVQLTPLGPSPLESAQPVSILGEDELTLQGESSLGESVATAPGVSSTSFGPGASRPLIRGLGGDRIRVLENGLGVQDISHTSPDHAVAVDPSLADRIEIVRGPAALLFGSSAVGGVVNVENDRIPIRVPEGGSSGLVESRYGTVDDGRSGAGKLNLSAGPLVLHVDGSLRKTDDYRIPGFARTPALRDEAHAEGVEPRGTVPFSSTELASGAIGTSYLLDNGAIGIAAGSYDSTYGVPNGEENVFIDLEQRRYEARALLFDPLPGFESSDFRWSVADYTHTEFEGDKAGTVFDSDGMEARLELRLLPIGQVEGLVGFQLQTVDLSVVGEEAFLPPNESMTYSMFMLEELRLSAGLKAQAGARLDLSEQKANGYIPPGADPAEGVDGAVVRRHFTATGASAGLVYDDGGQYTYTLSTAYTERTPSNQELFANGAHVATAAFEVGDPDIEVERSIGTDLTATKRSGLVTGSVGGFYNRFFNYIDLAKEGSALEGQVESEFPVYEFVQRDAHFFGLEAEAAYHLFGKADPNLRGNTDLSVFVRGDSVWAARVSPGTPLSRMPPIRLGVGTKYDSEQTKGSVELRQIFRQERNSPDESETPGYTDLSIRFSHELIPGAVPVLLLLRGENLLNEKQRNHVSFIKDVAPLPGLNVTAGLQVRF